MPDMLTDCDSRVLAYGTDLIGTTATAPSNVMTAVARNSEV